MLSYYQPRGESALNLELMRLLDEEFTRHDFKGVLGLRDHLRLAGYPVNEKRVRRFDQSFNQNDSISPRPEPGE